MNNFTEQDIEFLINHTYISYWGSRALQETNLCVMWIGVKTTAPGTYLGKKYEEGDILDGLSKANHGWGSWHPSPDELKLPEGVAVDKGTERIVRKVGHEL